MKRFEGKGVVTDVKNKIDDDGKSTGKLFQVVDVEWKGPLEDMPQVFDKEADRKRFKEKYWRDSGKLSIDKVSDAIKLGSKIIGGIVSFRALVGGTELHRFEGGSVKGVKVQPEPGRNVVMKYSLSITPANEAQAGYLSMLKGREIFVIVDRAQAEMELADGAEDEKPEEAQGDLPGTEKVAGKKEKLPGRKPPQQRKSVRDASKAGNGAAAPH